MSQEQSGKRVLTPPEVITYMSQVPASQGDCYQISYIVQALQKTLARLLPEFREGLAAELEALGFTDFADAYRLQAFEDQLSDIDVDGGE